MFICLVRSLPVGAFENTQTSQFSVI